MGLHHRGLGTGCVTYTSKAFYKYLSPGPVTGDSDLNSLGRAQEYAFLNKCQNCF